MWKTCTIVLTKKFKNWEAHSEGIVRTIETHRVLEWEWYSKYPCVKDTTITMHRIILETFNPQPLRSLECDHRNMTKDDFGLENLRWVSKSLNQAFRPCRGFSIYAKKDGSLSYIPQFRKKNYTRVNTADKARKKHIEVKNAWIAEERERITDLVIEKYNCTHQEARERLNWDDRDIDGASVFSLNPNVKDT